MASVNAVSLFQTKKLNNKTKPQQISSTPQYVITEQDCGISLQYPLSISFTGATKYTANEREFMHFRKQFGAEAHRLQRESEIANWEFRTNSSEENKIILDQAQQKYNMLFHNEKILAKLKSFEKRGIKDSLLKAHLQELLAMFEAELKAGEEQQDLTQQETAIMAKLNSFKRIINGVEYADSELRQMLQHEKNASMRKKIYIARQSDGDLVAADLIELVKARNATAKKYGYKNYIDLVLINNYKITVKELLKIINEIEEKTAKPYFKLKAKEDKQYAKFFKIKPNELMPWHYGLLINGSAYHEADKYIQTREQILPLSLSLFKKMGWDIKKLPITFDLYPREMKQEDSACLDISIPDDIRILLNLSNRIESFEFLNHELGHAVYDTGISSHICYMDRKCSSYLMSEAIALIFQTLPYREEKFLIDKLKIPAKTVGKLEKYRKEELLKDMRLHLLGVLFEIELYKNPNQDINKLWFGLKRKILGKNSNKDMPAEWANITQFIENPGYYQNYLRGEMLAAQIYKKAVSELGPLTENKKTAEYFKKNLFRYGDSRDEDYLIKQIAGGKIKSDALCEQFKDLG